MTGPEGKASSKPSGIETFSEEQPAFAPSEEFRRQAHIGSREQYEALYRESLEQPESFWQREASELVFRSPWSTLCQWEPPLAGWFKGAELNITESCLDRHLQDNGARVALIWESEEGEVRKLSYRELHEQVVRLSAGLRGLGVGKGDRVAIYMGLVPEAAVAMLACARIGATHSVVFGGFAAEALRDRINDCQAKVVITQDGAPRRGQVVPLKAMVDQAVEGAASVAKVVVLRRLGEKEVPINWSPERDVDYQSLTQGADPAAGAAEIVASEHPLFILYTSGSTGKPKGIVHSTAGYLVGVHVSTKYAFDLRPEEDIYWCTADVGWITGHSYVVYGPLSNGATCLIYEGAPNYPDWSRFWKLVERHRVSILYTAPTAIRAFMKAGESWLDGTDRSSLRLLGSVGEPINPEAWRWYYENVGQGRCPVVDTWWQTETGSIMTTTLPGAVEARPGSTGLPFFGVEPAVVDESGAPVAANAAGLFVLKRPWPSMLRGIWGDPERFEKQYFSDIPGCYFTGDGAHASPDGYLRVVGRVDDVINVSGHRIGTAEIESIMVGHPAVSEAAAVGRPDALKGQALVVFVSLAPGAEPSEATRASLMDRVASDIGKFARPDEIRFAEGLPKTRSGKIMRRLLKDIAAGRSIQGDLSTLEDESVLQKLLDSP